MRDDCEKDMKKYKIISWSRDRGGKIVNRNFRDVCNALTTFSASSHTTAIYVLVYENKINRIHEP